MPFHRRRSFKRKRSFKSFGRFKKGGFHKKRRMSFKSGVLRALHNRPKPEGKFTEHTDSITLTTADTPQTLLFTDIAQSDGVIDRIGNRIEPKKLTLRYRTSTSNTTAGVENHIRVVIIRIKDRFGSGSLPTWATLFNATNVLGMPMPKNYEAAKTNYRILWDKTFNLYPGSTNFHSGMIRIKFKGIKCFYDGPLSTAIHNNMIAMYIINNLTGINGWTINGFFRYVDA